MAMYTTTIQGPDLRKSWLLKRRWLYHVLFWVIYNLFVGFLFFNLYGITEPVFYLLMLLFLPGELLLTYFNFYVLMPRLLFAGKYFRYALALLACIVAISICNVFIHRLNVSLGSHYYGIGVEFSFRIIFARTFELFSIISITTGMKLAKDWLLQLQWIREKEKQYLETELNFLKSQINPHFFFNTLNNLYSLTLKKSDLAPEVVLKLSDLMSYMLYESNTPKIALDKEITYLKNYIDVEQLRFGQRLQVQFNISGPTEQVAVPPMLLILFVENSFKHGTRHIIHQIHIRISLAVHDGFVHFRVENPVGNNFTVSEQTGIGLKNAQRRLELLYGSQYTLDMHIKDNQYIVSLKIPVW
jgi:Putative regulator of cell autolysis